jgi:membrane associated rhomboid family serine protease
LLPATNSEKITERPIVNEILIFVNIGIFVVTYFFPWVILPNTTSINDIIEFFGITPYYIINGERLWTIFTAMFIHTDIVHVLGNMLFLYIFGDSIEIALGKVKYLLFYFLSGTGAALFYVTSITLVHVPETSSIISQMNNPWLIPAVGASGAISGVLGAYIMLYPSSMVKTLTLWFWAPVVINFPAIIFIVIWFIYQLVLAVLTTFSAVYTGIAFWAHVGGFLTGIAVIPFFARKKFIKAF